MPLPTGRCHNMLPTDTVRVRWPYTRSVVPSVIASVYCTQPATQIPFPMSTHFLAHKNPGPANKDRCPEKPFTHGCPLPTAPRYIKSVTDSKSVAHRHSPVHKVRCVQSVTHSPVPPVRCSKCFALNPLPKDRDPQPVVNNPDPARCWQFFAYGRPLGGVEFYC